jgi:hypothetical protein
MLGSAPEISKDAYAGLLQQDIQHYDDLVRDHLSRIQQLLLLMFPVFGTAGTLLYGYHQYVVLLALPIVGCITLFIGANTTGEMFALAAYKYYLEQVFFNVLRQGLQPDMRGQAPPPWDSTGGQVRRRSISYVAIQGAYILTLAAVSIIAITVAWQKVGHFWWLAPIIAAITATLFLLALWSYFDAMSSYDATLLAIRDAELSVTGSPGAAGEA